MTVPVVTGSTMIVVTLAAAARTARILLRRSPMLLLHGLHHLAAQRALLGGRNDKVMAVNSLFQLDLQLLEQQLAVQRGLPQTVQLVLN